MISKPAQNITVAFGFISVRHDLSLPQGVPQELNRRTVDWDALSTRQSEIRDQFKAISQ
jgi:hypothetical protein